MSLFFTEHHLISIGLFVFFSPQRQMLHVFSYFYGVWDVHSKTTDVIAPCGIALFGGNNTYTKAQNEIGTTLTYKSRFIPTTAAAATVTSTFGSSNNSSNNNSNNNNNNELTVPKSAPIIADREYNVVEIAKSVSQTSNKSQIKFSSV